MREHSDNAPVATAEQQLPAFLIEVLGELVAAERDRQRGELEVALQPLRSELSELRGQITTMLALLGGRAAPSDNVVVPKMPLKGRAIAA